MKINDLFDSGQCFVIVPKEFLESLLETQNEILQILKKEGQPKIINDYVLEADARKEFKKGSTWFWNKRKIGELRFVKVGGKVYYHRDELQRLFNKPE